MTPTTARWSMQARLVDKDGDPELFLPADPSAFVLFSTNQTRVGVS